MHSSHSEGSPAEVVDLAGYLNTGLGILTFQFFPFALPLLLLTFGPLVVLALPFLLIGGIVALPIWLVRRLAAAVRSTRR
jgi:hypothetical protein